MFAGYAGRGGKRLNDIDTGQESAGRSSRVERISVIIGLILFSLLHYWHTVQGGAPIPASRINPDNSLTIFGEIFQNIWIVAPALAWLLFVYSLLSALRIKSTDLILKALCNNPAAFNRHLAVRVMLVAMLVSLLFGSSRLAIECYGLHIYPTENAFVLPALEDEVMNWASFVFIYIAVSMFVVYRYYRRQTKLNIFGSFVFSWAITTLPGYIFVFIGWCVVLNPLWFFPAQDGGMEYSEPQLLLAGVIGILYEFAPIIISLVLIVLSFRRLNTFRDCILVL